MFVLGNPDFCRVLGISQLSLHKEGEGNSKLAFYELSKMDIQ